MNYQRRRPPYRRPYHYLMPFLMIVVIVAIIIFGWRILNQTLIGGSLDASSEKVFLNIEQGSVKAMTVGKSEWQNAYDNIYLYRGEKVKTGVDGRSTLTFFNESILRMDSGTELDLLTLQKRKETDSIEVSLTKGQVWAKVERITNPDSRFTISTDRLSISSRGGTLGITAPGTVQVVEGSAQVGIKSDDGIIKTVNVGIGQQLMVDEESLAALREGMEKDIIFALSDGFKASNWYRWNRKKDGAITAYEESDLETDVPATEEPDVTADEGEPVLMEGLVTVVSPKNKSATTKSTIALSGYYDPDRVSNVYVDGKKASLTGTNQWKIYELALSGEGEHTLPVEAETKEGERTSLNPLVITLDTTAPATPSIKKPGANDETVTIADVEQEISGTVSKDTYAVIVNDYRLGKYVPGSQEFAYFAKTAYGNLKVGKNEYLVYAEDKAGNQSTAAKITLILEQDTVDKAAEEKPAVTDELPAASSTGGVSITAPNDGESFTTSETEFEITGDVPEGTAKVVVNDYTLQAFEEGDTSFKYRASSTLGNLVIGEKNTYTAKAYDADDSLLGSASITIDVESDSSGAPVIIMPSTEDSYETTLNELVVGGTVGKWIQKIYLNGKMISDYIPGSEKWRKTVSLAPGSNTFTVYGEKDGEKTIEDSITIEYKN